MSVVVEANAVAVVTGPARVLLVEDDPDQRFAVRLALEGWGWDVGEAGSAREGLDAIGTFDPDVVLLDLGLPDADGLDVLVQLKADEATSWIPVVVLSGRSNMGEMSSLLRAGAQDYVVKPFSTDELEARLVAARRVAVGHRRLVESDRRYRTAFEAAPVGMAQIGPDGRYMKVNRALSEVLGYSTHELERMGPIDVTHPDDVASLLEGGRVLAGGRDGALRGERRFVDADGDVVWVAVSAVVVPGREGERDHVLVHYVDITDRKHFEQQLQHLADHDALTGLLNRRGFQRELEAQVARSARYGSAGALLVLDVDHFKQINDTLGHTCGDELIVAMADLLRRSVRQTDVVARLGGDEFAVILPFATEDDAEVLAGKIVRAARDHVLRLGGSQARTVTVSVGVAFFDDPRQSGEDVLMNADLTMYEAKDAGRDRHAVRRT